MDKQITINTSYGHLEFTLTGNTMTVLNTDTGENISCGDPDQGIVNAMDDEYGDEYAAQVGQEWADNFYAEEMTL